MSLIRKKTLQQMKRLRQLTKGIDIGDKMDISKLGDDGNALDKDLISWEDYMDREKKRVPKRVPKRDKKMKSFREFDNISV